MTNFGIHGHTHIYMYVTGSAKTSFMDQDFKIDFLSYPE